MQLLEARKALARRLAEDGITNLVETYDPERFNLNASVAENLLFGTPIGPVFDFEALADNAYLLQVLTQVGLIEDLVAAGKQVAETMVEMFADLPADHEFFEQFSFISANDLPEFVAILGRIGEGGTAALAKQDRAKLLSLPFKLVPARHRLDIVDDSMQHRLLEARRVFRADLPQQARQQIEFFDPERYNAAASVQDNILFGKIAYGEADAPTRIPKVLGEVIDGLSLRHVIIDGATAEGRNRPRRAQTSRPPHSQRGDLCPRRSGPDQDQQRVERGICRPRDHLGAAPGEPRAEFRSRPHLERRQAARAR
jgi:hypothetical protein